MRLFRNVAGCFMFLLVLPAVLHAQIVQEFKPPKASCCLPSVAQTLADQLQDWNQLGRYRTIRNRKGSKVTLRFSIPQPTGLTQGR